MQTEIRPKRAKSRVLVLNGEQLRIVTPEGSAITVPHDRAMELFFSVEFRESVRHAMNQFDNNSGRE